ncbi:MAG: adenylosuccinate lyase [Bacteroidetes bacterium CG2_30_33_31]|nr:MAG: adenylosuccinate lyase [Bacteroidetes bacterium CG2_30_33_31]
MNTRELTAISPIDGRYRSKVENLTDFFSEAGLIKYRVLVEIEYFISLCQIPLPQLINFKEEAFDDLRDIYLNFSLEDASKIKEIEEVTNHDVKAVEYFIKEQFEKLNLSDFKEFIHFGLTSQDINNTAIPLIMKDAFQKIYEPLLLELMEKIQALALEWKNIPMLARTHGQPASPTKLGKEIYVFYNRLNEQYNLLKSIPFAAKFGGATGNFNAHNVAFPEIDWVEFANIFVNDILELKRSAITTQIEHYDHLAAFLDGICRINNILVDLCRDFWTYISIGYFSQKIKEGEIGSSAMPHKINPIDFENAEGNLGMANAVGKFISSKLPISRLQRDLTDSTVLRNIGLPFAHSIVAYKSLMKGIDKLIINEKIILSDLDKNWAVIAEAIQTILRREGYPNPYEALKELTRTNQTISQESIAQFIDNLEISDSIKLELKEISPFNYTGIDFI